MDIYSPLLTVTIKNSLISSIFSDELKLTERISLFKKLDYFDKTNYRPVSLLSHVSKIFVRIIDNQIDDYKHPRYIYIYIYIYIYNIYI